MSSRFIEIHEREIKQYRDEYYKNIITTNQKTAHTCPVITFLIPLIIAILLPVILEFTITSFVASVLILIILNLIIYTLFTSRIDKNEYLEAIRRHGYKNIEEYELKVSKYITNPDGYYHSILLELIEKYNINSSTRRIVTKKNDEYYIWSNKNKDKIYLLGTHSNVLPEIKTIPISDIRYYRLDNQTNTLILKTKNELYKFKPDYISIFNDLLKSKRLEDIKRFEPGIYIDDYEIYMHKVKKNLQKDNYSKKEKLEKYIHNSIYTIIAIAILIILTIVLPSLSNITNIINCLLIICLNISINGILNNIVKKTKKSEKEIITELNSNPEHIEIFKELKYVLGIHDNYDKVYTNEGAEYVTWVANGYFHVFLNMIYFNAVYMSVKTSNVKYFKEDISSCDIKLKDKTLEFTKDSSVIFQRLLPNKDYHWIKTYQNR